jgi:hypothetical protein
MNEVESSVAARGSLYESLAEPAHTAPVPTPDTVETRQIETIDNDFATTLLVGPGLS